MLLVELSIVLPQLSLSPASLKADYSREIQNPSTRLSQGLQGLSRSEEL